MGNILCCPPGSSSAESIRDDYKFSKKDFLGVSTSSILDDYKFEKMLGFGSYGEVRLGRHIKTHLEVAIKKINT